MHAPVQIPAEGSLAPPPVTAAAGPELPPPLPQSGAPGQWPAAMPSPPPLPGYVPLATGPLSYERMAQPVKARVVCEAHEDGLSFTQHFSAGRALMSIGWWVVLLVSGLAGVGMMYLQARYDMGMPNGVWLPVLWCCLMGWTVFRIACEVRAWGQPVVLAVRGGKLVFDRPTLGRRRKSEWPVERVKRIDVAIGSATQHATKSLRIRFHGGGRISFFECAGREEGMWIARKLAAVMELPDEAIH